MSESPFHEGEQRVQSRLGVREEIEPWARRVVRPELPEAHRAFYAQLPFLVLAARDAEGRPWATLLAGEPGFAASPDPSRLHIAALPAEGDALADSLRDADDVGLLGIELHTRRRNRVNGRVAGRNLAGLEFSVDQSFGNCPQYITERRWRPAPADAGAARGSRGTGLSKTQQEWIRGADTFFIATGYRGPGEDARFGMDASHRGGAPGFVRAEGANEIVFPDYAGNNHFNTIGNLLMDPRVGLLFVDFERGDLLQVSGRARIDWDSDAVARSAGARRLVHVEIDAVVCLENALPLRWEAAGAAQRELRLVEKRVESADVTSFVFASRDGGPLPPFAPGQHLPITLHVPGHEDPVRRTYSLSGSSVSAQYRISVKREPRGVASRFLHDTLEVGDFVLAGSPAGSFVLDTTSDRPVALVGAGVGLTPLVSMLHALAGGSRGVRFVHGARDGEHTPLRAEVDALVASASNAASHRAFSRPLRGDLGDATGRSRGRVDAELLEKLVPGLAADFYLCGPQGFMAALQGQLEARGVPADRIHSESFGPVG